MGCDIKKRAKTKRATYTEEVQSWEIFDEARKNSETAPLLGISQDTTPNGSTSNNTVISGNLNGRTATQQRRKRKK